jgi:uncharacterized protein YbjT (DUF2867 family)
MITKPKILLLGATGQVGRAVLPHLKATHPEVDLVIVLPPAPHRHQTDGKLLAKLWVG